jgi:hypothetical protein
MWLANETANGADMMPPEAKSRLTDGQRKSISELSNKFDLENAQTLAQLKVSQRQLYEILASSNVDRQTASALQNKINSLNGTISTARLNLLLAISEILTPEQKQEMARRPLPPMPFEFARPPLAMPGFPPPGISSPLSVMPPALPMIGDPMLGCPPEALGDFSK